MKWIFLLLLYIQNVSAQTQVLFAKDQTKATVFMLATTSNPDAIALNDLLTVEPVSGSGKLTKTLNFKNEQNELLLNIACSFSILAPQTGSCFVNFPKSTNVQWSSSQKTVEFSALDSLAQDLITQFLYSPNQPEIFKSSDGKMKIEALFLNNIATQISIKYGIQAP